MLDFIFITGTSGVGKSTLAQSLLKKLRTVVIEQNMVPEFISRDGIDPNLCVLVDGETDIALMRAVVFCDYYLAEYLLKHGADPKMRLFLESELLKTDKEYWLLGDLAIRIMNHADEKEAELAADIAHLIWRYGLRGWSGFCIEMDDEKGLAGIHSMKVRY